MRGSQRLLQRLLQCGAVGEALRAAAGGSELAAARSLARTVAARGFAAAGQQAWRAGALRPAAGSFAAAHVRWGGICDALACCCLRSLSSGLKPLHQLPYRFPTLPT